MNFPLFHCYSKYIRLIPDHTMTSICSQSLERLEMKTFICYRVDSMVLRLSGLLMSRWCMSRILSFVAPSMPVDSVYSFVDLGWSSVLTKLCQRGCSKAESFFGTTTFNNISNHMEVEPGFPQVSLPGPFL